MHSIYYIHTTHYSRILTKQNILFLRDIHTNSWYSHAGILDDLILCGFRCAFSCMFEYSLCRGMDIGTCDIAHWSAVPRNCITNRTGFLVYVVQVLNVIRYSCHHFLDRILFHHDFHHDSCDYHWDFMAINYLLIYTLGFLYISNSGSANAQLPGCFCPWTFSLNIGLSMFPLDSFMSCLHFLLGYSTGEFQALQLIVLAAFGAVD